MAIIYTYKMKGIKKKNEVNSDGVTLRDAVVQTYWELTGTDEADNTTGMFSGATPFTAENVPEGEFTEFSALTEDTVLAWVTSYVQTMPGYFEHMEEQIASQLEEAKGLSAQDALMPWAPEEGLMVPSAADMAPGADPTADPE